MGFEERLTCDPLTKEQLLKLKTSQKYIQKLCTRFSNRCCFSTLNQIRLFSFRYRFEALIEWSLIFEVSRSVDQIQGDRENQTIFPRDQWLSRFATSNFDYC